MTNDAFVESDIVNLSPRVEGADRPVSMRRGARTFARPAASGGRSSTLISAARELELLRRSRLLPRWTPAFEQATLGRRLVFPPGRGRGEGRGRGRTGADPGEDRVAADD